MDTQAHDTNTSQAQPLVLRLLAFYGMTRKTVARQIPEVDYHTVKRALHPESFRGTRYETVVRARERTETLLRAAGWKGTSKELWREFDERLDHKQAA